MDLENLTDVDEPTAIDHFLAEGLITDVLRIVKTGKEASVHLCRANRSTTGEDLRQAYLVRTVGFLVGEGPRFVSLAQEILPDGEGFRAVTHIPLAIVERLVRLDAWEGSQEG